ncbi:putative O-methyltransferase YrrM [Scopulibacillus darangshiensis]|uniref:tRNA 5-hydroxyuridine methyltransferase n=1 Tax=Scopulibacillus darangshiensis TaxID=442528 RepID=A0A4R2PB11_9BACL|nr:O-methyltransferase [Scopulibacillus darangshiensis]TCP32289.1 putative O-methyltransferase YrrM [Scopulibacillus darangshiensis]
MDFSKAASYVASFVNEDNKELKGLESEARERGIPIMQPEAMALVQHMIKWLKPERILEIGTAVGFSAIKMALASRKRSKIITVERDDDMFHEAKKNILSMGVQDSVHLVHADAMERHHDTVEQGPYDIIFIDAAKGQYQHFFELYAPLLTLKGLIITDNILFRGFAAEPETAVSKRLERLANKVNDFNHWLSENDQFDTVYLTVGDGLAISSRREKKDI